MSYINKQVENFTVQAYHAGEFKEVTLEDTKGKWAVYFFYPADFSFVCPTELVDVQDHYETFKEMNCEIYSVSTDTHYVHKAWADATDTIKRIEYPMLADPSQTLSKQFGVLVEDEGVALRGTFIVNPEGMIKAYEVNDMGIGRNAEELVRKVQAAQFVAEHGDKVCPAKWTPGEETLEPSLDLVGKI
ncbi:alkyl hydroperoxide reductase subunit C [Bacillus massiliigorillae]|uniref:alkyl hydroperoxide reductase subunit C n=1 Tax=Bacillus massiliigorillae TaxID=1243664 RepID=UPI00039D80DB|nr:alkyl hydroperoxide reductase subunit C [Bacillus massiliigorillae]